MAPAWRTIVWLSGELVAVVALLVASFFLSAALGVAVGTVRVGPSGSFESVAPIAVVAAHLALLAYAAFLERRRLAGWFRLTSRGIVEGTAGGAIMLVTGMAWASLLALLGVELPDVAGQLRSLLPSAVLLVWGAFVVPLAEELYFRGRLLDRVSERAGPEWGLAVMAVAFAAAHGIAVFFPVYVVFALLLAALRRRNAGLVAPVVAHALNNLLGLVVPGPG